MFIPCTGKEKELFFRIPKILFEEDPYKNGLDLTSKIVYALLRDRYELSLSNENEWIDKNGIIFCFFSRENLQKILNKSERTIKKAIEQLKSFGLVKEKRQGLGRANMIYVGQIRSVDNEYSRHLENEVIVPLEIRTNDTKNKNTKINNTEKYMALQKSDARISFSVYTYSLSNEEFLEYQSVLKLIDYYLALYIKYVEEDHPELTIKQWEQVKESILTSVTDANGTEYEISVEDEVEMMESYLNLQFRNCNYSLLHYVSGDIRLYRYFDNR